METNILQTVGGGLAGLGPVVAMLWVAWKRMQAEHAKRQKKLQATIDALATDIQELVEYQRAEREYKKRRREEKISKLVRDTGEVDV